jgi:hypothetical protein
MVQEDKETVQSESKDLDDDPEFRAMQRVHAALAPLQAEARQRVLDYVIRRLSMKAAPGAEPFQRERPAASREAAAEPEVLSQEESADEPIDESLDGISPVALKWMRRSGFTSEQLGSIFSLGIDDIDLITKTIPGRGKGSRMQNILRLKGIARYLASGVARVSHDEFNDACSHYNAHDVPHFSENMRKLGGEISGTKETGYQLTAKGLTAATALIKEMVANA